MKKLQIFLAGALLTLPLALNAGTLPDSSAGSELNPTHSVAGTCYVYFAGRWYAIPC